MRCCWQAERTKLPVCLIRQAWNSLKREKHFATVKLEKESRKIIRFEAAKQFSEQSEW
jgi:hypothetical protein